MELFGRTAHRISSGSGQALLYICKIQNLDDVGIEFCNDTHTASNNGIA